MQRCRSRGGGVRRWCANRSMAKLPHNIGHKAPTSGPGAQLGPQRKTSSCNCPPVTASLSAVTAHLSAVTAHLSAVTAHLSAVTAHLSAVTAHLSAVTANLSAVTANLSAVSANLSAVSAHLSAVTANLLEVTSSRQLASKTKHQWLRMVDRSSASFCGLVLALPKRKSLCALQKRMLGAESN